MTGIWGGCGRPPRGSVWTQPARGSVPAATSSGDSPPAAPSRSMPRQRRTARTASPMEPRWTGIWGALAINPPFGSNTAQEKNGLPRGSGDGFFVQGDFATGPVAAILMPSDEAVARMGGHWEVAITDNTNYDMIQAELRMVGLGDVAQSLETMSADIGNCPFGLDRSLPGHYPIATLLI